jgi:transcriptional regulator with XRE-family HTH domain
VDQPPGIGSQIRRARELRGWSQEELARRAGVNRKTVANIELGRTAKLRNATSRFEVALGVSLSPSGRSPEEEAVERLRRRLSDPEAGLPPETVRVLVDRYRLLIRENDDQGRWSV